MPYVFERHLSLYFLFCLIFSTYSFFQHYYTWDERFATEEEARASILAHMRDNMRRTLADDRERAEAKMATAKGTTYADHRPGYMKPGVWSRLAEYWVSEEFKKKSEAGKKAREAVKVPHTSGARSFDRRRRVCCFSKLLDLHLSFL